MKCPRGFRFGAVEAAVKRPGRLDMGLVYCETEAVTAAVFTRNLVAAAPVELSRKRAARGRARAILVNAGNANACTGPRGVADATRLTSRMAELLGVAPEEVLVCSTGVIGLPLPVDRMEAALTPLRESLSEDITPFAKSIMTTDTVMKVAERAIEVGSKTIHLLGATKGAGMIRPDMATMLGFVVTDAAIEATQLQKLLVRAADRTFNRITIDGDTSTNDTLIVMASGLSEAADLTGDLDGMARFSAALEDLCRELARMIVKDGEGATKLVDVTVTGAESEAAAFQVARTIAESPLVKTALNGEDPNWGRIAGALGRSGAYKGGPFDIAIGGAPLVRDGFGLGEDAEREVHQIMHGPEFEILVTLREGEGRATVTTCDFSADYVRINADYRS